MICLLAMCLCFCFVSCVMAHVLVFCVPCAHVICLDPTHLVTCLLINFPQLLSLVTLLICSLYNLLVFAVPCGFIAICWVVIRLVSCLVLPCQFVFPLPTGLFLFVCFYLLFINKKHFFPPAFGSSLSSLPPILAQGLYGTLNLRRLFRVCGPSRHQAPRTVQVPLQGSW